MLKESEKWREIAEKYIVKVRMEEKGNSRKIYNYSDNGNEWK